MTQVGQLGYGSSHLLKHRLARGEIPGLPQRPGKARKHFTHRARIAAPPHRRFEVLQSTFARQEGARFFVHGGRGQEVVGLVPEEKIDQSFLYRPLSMLAPLLFPYLHFDFTHPLDVPDEPTEEIIV